MNLRGEEKMISSCVSGQDGRVLSERPRQKILFSNKDITLSEERGRIFC